VVATIDALVAAHTTIDFTGLRAFSLPSDRLEQP
jgi:hypothetical protein